MPDKTYDYVVGVEDNYPTEPSDEQCVILLRALWHYATAYEPRAERFAAMTVGEIIDDLMRATGGSGYGMTRDEWVEIGRATGVPV